MKFIYFPGRYRRSQALSGTPVRWYACTGGRFCGKFDYHASFNGLRPICRTRVRLLDKDPRPDPPPDPSRDPWTCTACQELVKRVPTEKPTSIEVLNRALSRALLGAT
jgi:hypothetical protein